MEYIWEIIWEYLPNAGAVLGISILIGSYITFDVKSKSNSQKTNIKGHGNTVETRNEQNESHDGHATASGQGNISIGKAQNVSINQDNSNVQMPIEEFKRRIELERNDAVEEYKKANNDEKPLYLMKVTEFDNMLADLPKYYQKAQELISTCSELLVFVLKRGVIGKGMDIDKLTEATNSLNKGDFSKIDAGIAEIEKHKGLNTTELANVIFTRGKIAEQEIRWRDAAEHYTRAARLDPKFDNLIMAQRLAIDVGNYPSALSLGEEAKKAAINEYGEYTVEYADSLNNLGAVYKKIRQYENAKPLHKECLRIRKKVLGEKHPDIANSLNNLGTVYHSLGEYAKAKSLYQQAISIQTEVLNENHPIIAITLNNLAEVYLKNGEYEKVEPLFEKALKIRQETFGKNHPQIANSLNNLGGFYFRQRQYEKAEPLCKQALEILETILGLEHPDTKQVKGNYEEIKKAMAAS